MGEGPLVWWKLFVGLLKNGLGSGGLRNELSPGGNDEP